jgi:hypothetical protein
MKEGAMWDFLPKCCSNDCCRAARDKLEATQRALGLAQREGVFLDGLVMRQRGELLRLDAELARVKRELRQALRDARAPGPFRIHCVYCRETFPVTTIAPRDTDPDWNERLRFEREHEARCGPKAIGLMAS